MKLKRWLLVAMLVLLTGSLTACENWISFWPSQTTQATTTRPVPVNGTLTFDDAAYNQFAFYTSPTYGLDDIHAYNDVLFQTQNHIRHANIDVRTTLTEERYPAPWSNQKVTVEVGTSNGSGFVFMADDTSYYAITNYHVINPKTYTPIYEIKAYGDDAYHTAEVIAYDSNLDLAVVAFEKGHRTSVELLDIETRLYTRFEVGEMVLAVGNPLSLENNVTFGEIISLRSIDNVDYKVIYHNAMIKEGSSGGALVDVDGHLLGVNAWGVDSTDVYSFAIPNYIVYMFLVNQGVLDQ